MGGVLLLSLVPFLASCGGSGTPVSATTPPPTPKPTPVAASPTPDPSIPPASSGCGEPYPPKITRLNPHIHYKFKEYWQIDTTPLVGPDALYCQTIGYTDGRAFCSIRLEGAPDRAACELWAAGVSKDTPPRPGPTWTLQTPDGVVHYCTGPDSGCEHYDGPGLYDEVGGPYQVKAYKGGVYTICVADGVCASTDVDRNL